MNLKRGIFQVEKEGRNFPVSDNSMCRRTEEREIVVHVVNIRVQGG